MGLHKKTIDVLIKERDVRSMEIAVYTMKESSALYTAYTLPADKIWDNLWMLLESKYGGLIALLDYDQDIEQQTSNIIGQEWRKKQG